MSHHTKDKGDLGVLKVIASLGSQGFLILNPLTEHSPFDLVVYKDKQFFRIQVKYRTAKNGYIVARLSNSWADKNGTHTTPMDLKEVDYIAVYCPDTDDCYYIKSEECTESITLRIETPKNNQKEKVRMIENYKTISPW